MLVVLLLGLVLVAAQTATSDDNVRAPRPVKWAKLSSGLAAVARAERDGGRGLQVARANGMRIQDGRVLVVVEAQTTRSKAVAAVVAVRGVVVAAHAELVQAYVAPGALLRLTRAVAVAYVRTPRTPILG